MTLTSAFFMDECLLNAIWTRNILNNIFENWIQVFSWEKKRFVSCWVRKFIRNTHVDSKNILFPPLRHISLFQIWKASRFFPHFISSLQSVQWFEELGWNDTLEFTCNTFHEPAVVCHRCRRNSGKTFLWCEEWVKIERSFNNI